MPLGIVTGETLMANPSYPHVAHVPLSRLRLDPASLPPQRLKPDGTPVCLAGDHPVDGGALLCDACKRASRNEAQRRRRESASTAVQISKANLRRIHEGVDALSPLINDLTVAYNNGGNLRDEVHRIMLEIKTLERVIRVHLPDPRTD